MRSDPTYLGTVQDVQGASISVALDDDTVSGLAFCDGHGYRIGQLGSFVRIPVGFVDLFGVVSQIGASAVPGKFLSTTPHGLRWMTVQLVGEGQRHGDFERGLSQYPTVSDPVHLVTERDLARIYGQQDRRNLVQVGHLASAESIPAFIDVDKLVTRHSAVVGTTGAGKSTTVAGLLASLSDPSRFASARILVLDIHGEYPSALEDRATVFRINPNAKRGEKPLFIPYWAMTFDELLPLTFGGLDGAERGAVLEKITALKSLALAKWERKGVTADNLTVDTPIPFSIHQLWFEMHHLVNATHDKVPTGQSDKSLAYQTDESGAVIDRGDAMDVRQPKFKPATQAAGAEKIYLSGSSLNIRRPLENVASRLRDPRFDFLFRPGSWTPDTAGSPAKDLDTLLEDWLGGPQPISILDLSGIPVSILTNLVGVLLRIVYDALFWGRKLVEGGRLRPLLIVLEEAHAYVGQGDTGPAASAVKRIAKEGRKYGIGAMIVSQRPSEIDSTILSQCGTIFAMRLANATDRSHVKSAVTENLEGLFSMLPILRTGEAIIVGEAVHLPVRTLVEPPQANCRPDSSDPLIYNEEGTGGWDRPRAKSDYADLVAVWRKQEPRSSRIVDIEESP
jgi:uncharacterized protein